MASSEYDFGDLNPMTDSVPSSRSSPSTLPSGELNFDKFVDVSSPGCNTGGDDVIMSEINDLVTVEVDDKMEMSSVGGVTKEHGVGVIKFTCAETRQMCKGVIGKSSGTRFCSRLDCNIASHKSQKVSLAIDETRYYIKDSRDQQVFTEPSIPSNWVKSSAEISILENSLRSPSVWKIFFQRFDNTIMSSDVIDGKAEYSDSKIVGDVAEQLDQIQSAKDGLKTPRRKTRFNLVDEVIDSAVDTQPIALPKRPKLEKLTGLVKMEDSVENKIQLMTVMLNQWDEIIFQVEELHDNLNSRTLADEKFREKIISSNLQMQSNQDITEDMSRILHNEIGEPSEEFNGLSIWESVQKVLGESSLLKSNLEALTPKLVMWNDLKSTNDSVESLKNESQIHTRSISKLLTDKSKVTQIENNLLALKNHYTNSFTSFKSQLVRLGERFQESSYSEYHRDGTSTANKNSWSSQDIERVTTLEEGMRSLRETIENLQLSLRSEGTETNFEKLNARVKEIESRVSGESVSINHNQFVFTSEIEVGLCLDTEGNNNKGIF